MQIAALQHHALPFETAALEIEQIADFNTRNRHVIQQLSLLSEKSRLSSEGMNRA